MIYHFPKKILGSRISDLADLQKTYENLTTKLEKILRKSYEVSKIGPLAINFSSQGQMSRSYVAKI